MLTGKQKRSLRAMGSVLEAIIHIGKGGVTEEVAAAVRDALTARELVKVRVLQNSPETPKELLSILAGTTGAELVQVIGRNGLLFKRNEEKPKIELPE